MVKAANKPAAAAAAAAAAKPAVAAPATKPGRPATGKRAKPKLFSRERVRRLARSMGVLRIGSGTTDYAVDYARLQTRILLPHIIALLGKRRVVTARDVVAAIEAQGVHVAGFQ